MIMSAKCAVYLSRLPGDALGDCRRQVAPLPLPGGPRLYWRCIADRVDRGKRIDTLARAALASGSRRYGTANGETGTHARERWLGGPISETRPRLCGGAELVRRLLE